jgi:hypothetical protein
VAYRPVLLPPKDIAHLIGRPVGTVKRWGTEGRLTKHNGLYDWLELAEVLEGRATVPAKRAA